MRVTYGMFALVCVAWLAPPRAQACTAVSATQGGPIAVAKTLDWDLGHGMLALNKQGVQKTSLTLNPADSPATWTSLYASLTFDQVGLEFPYEGMNEKGLSIDILWLDGSQYPAPDSRPAVNEVQWIQYQLDNAATLDEVVELNSKVRISPAYAQVHYFVCEHTGACGVFEYLNGNLVLHRGSNLPVPVLTNDFYDDSVGSLSQFTGFGGTHPIPQGSDSPGRFVRAASLLQKLPPSNVRDRVTALFDLLADVAAPSTQWSMVFLPETQVVQFQTHANPARHLARFAGFNLACASGTQIFDLSSPADASGEINGSFVSYSSSFNTQIANESTFLPDGFRKIISAYPEKNTRCVND